MVFQVISPAVKNGRNVQDGFYFIGQESVLDRFSLVSSASVVIFLDLTRANYGTALNLIYEQRTDTLKNVDRRIPSRLLLFHENTNPIVVFGSILDEEDGKHIITFSSVTQILALVAERQKQVEMVART